MKNLMIIVIANFITANCYSQINYNKTEKYSIPPLEEIGKGALISREFIYDLNKMPAAEAHASTIVETPTGLVTAFFAGTREGHPDVGIRVSRFQDGNWTYPVEVANGYKNDSLSYPTWNPVLFLPKDGPLLLFYKEGPNPQDWWGMLKSSSDNGKTWTDAESIGEDPAIGPLLGPVKNKPIQLNDGTIMSPSSIERIEDEDIKWMVHFEISKNNGRNWEVVGPINDGEDFDAIQPSLLELLDGRLMVLCRTRQGVIAQSWSKDKGKTWSKLEALDLPNPNSGTDAITLNDGRYLLIYNHKLKTKENRGRDILNLAISEDGLNWNPLMTIENEPLEYGYAYPAIIQASDGLVHATYTYDRKAIKHVVIDPKQL
ncbi:sialidase family protein [Salinimicrobium sp. TIG7-5_MAKvit]|uniref:sialidase family protein n=1 Tax=Salinimicrobium sp. TIG7-5_MAKvit TaxID=3121289 RepID=UPI003C6E8BAA